MALTLFLSCKDDISINIKDSENKLLVVDGFLKKRDVDEADSISRLLYIRLYESSNYEDDITDTYQQKAIENAIVSIIDSSTGITYKLKEIYPGVHTIPNDSLQINHSYKLSIDAPNWGQYESSYQRVNPYVYLDSARTLSYEYLSKNGYMFNLLSLENPHYIVASFTDPKNTRNFYAYEVGNVTQTPVNLTNMKILSDQDFGDGNFVPFEYLWLNAIVPEGTPIAQVYQLCINKNTFHYLKAIQNLSQTSSPFGSPPSNPISNIININNPSEDVLGFFEICTSTQNTFKFSKDK